MKKAFILSVCMLAISLSLHAQNTGPKIDPDGTVHFSLRAPKAEKVEVQGQFMSGSLAMVKGADGVWTASYKPAKADIYPYSFIVDGVQISDPNQNAELFPNENFKSSILEMPNPDALYTVKNVPHGDVHYNTFFSRPLGEWRKAVVYTPAEYDKNPDKEYPVFYLISGTTDTEGAWYKAGKANIILDNMIASGDAEPMIVVMPYGYVNAGTPRPNTIEAANMYKVFSNELVQTVIPFIDNTYRTIKNKDGRAISGFSRGGAQAIRDSYDPRVKTTIICNAGMGDSTMAGASSSDLVDIHSPILYLIGGPEDVAYNNAEIDFARINHVPVASVNFPVGHAGTYGQPEGGVAGKVALMWLDWQLKGNKDAARFFLDRKYREKNYPDCDFKAKSLK